MTKSSLIAVVAAVIAVAAVLAIVAGMWAAIGDVDISAAGWVAMAFGVLVALALGFGLMALVFFSSRRGFDDPGSGR